jgi:hypothetical protein
MQVLELQLIKELSEQAGITTNIDTDSFEKDPNKWVDYYSVKFAELIVQECVAVCLKNQFTGAPLYNDGALSSAELIKSRFGVEE